MVKMAMKIIDYPVEAPEGIFHFPQGVMCLTKQEDTGKEEVKIKRISGDEFEFEITPKDLTEVEQKDFPIRICEYEKLEEEDVEKEPKEIIKSEKRIDITKEAKQIIRIADGEILKIGNTISYSAGSNLITLDDIPGGAGSSWGAAYDMDNVVTNCGAVATKQGANAYDVSARMLFQPGVYFVSINEFVELRPNPANCVYTIRAEVGSHIRIGNYNSTDKYSYNGAFWQVYLQSTTGGQTTTGNRLMGEFLLYGSNFICDSTSYTRGPHFVSGATIRVYNSICKWSGYFWAVDCDVQDVKWHGGGGQYDMLVACGLIHAWGGLTTMGCDYGIFFSGTTTGNVDVYNFKPLNAINWDVMISTGISSEWLIRVINSPLAITCSTPGSGKRGVQFCYTFNVKVTNDVGTPIVGATVSLKDVDGADAFTPVQTIAGGVMPNDEIVKWYWFRHANDGGNKNYNDHTLKVTNGADETEYKIKIDHQITEDVVLVPQSVASYDNIMTAINDIKGTGFVKDTDSLVDIRPETDKIQTVDDNVDRILKATEIKQCIITDASATSLSFTTNLTETSNQFWQRGAILITSGNNEGQMRAILNYNGSTKAITLKTPLDVAPAQNDTFIILTERKYLTPDIEDIIDTVWDEPASDHVTSGTMGEYMKKIKSWCGWLRSLL